MGKFLYFHSNQKNLVNRALTIAKNFFSDVRDFHYTHSSEKELLFINNSKAIHINSFNFACGVPATVGSVADQCLFSFKCQVTEDVIQLIPDQTASRSVWYITIDDQIIISSSQRLIIQILNSFELNQQAISWFVATGSTGPATSWDRRIKHVLPGNRIIINKHDYSISTEKIGVKSYSDQFEKITDYVFSKFDNTHKWGITLSGGYDSRAVAASMVKQGIDVEAFTWGTVQSLENKFSDSTVAKEVADSLGITHTFISHSLGETNPEFVFDTYLKIGEGRIDHINSFSDGLHFWKRVYESDINGIVRADEAFGWLKASSEKDVRISLDRNYPNDYENFGTLFTENLQLPLWPDSFYRKKEETIATWRDRLYREYRIPYILSALHDLMLPFAEIINPFLYDPYIAWVKNQTDESRTNKTKYKRFVEQMMPTIPFAKTPAIAEPEMLLNIESYKNYVYEELTSLNSKKLFGQTGVTLASKMMRSKVTESLFKDKIKELLPYQVKKALRHAFLPYALPHNRIVLRLFLASKMIRILKDDSSGML